MSIRPKVLYFSAQLPSSRVPIAGQKVAWNNLKKLSLDNEIILFSFINAKEATFFEENDYEFCLDVSFKKISKFQKFKNYASRFYYPIKVTGRFQKSILEEVVNLIEKHKIKNIFFEFTSSLLYAREIKRQKPHLNIQFVEHDVTYQSYERFSKTGSLMRKKFFEFEYNRMKKFEIESLEMCDKVYTLNTKDKILLTEEGVDKVEVLFPQVDEWIHKVNRKVEPYTILFLGALHREENQDAILWFCDKVFPTICERFPASRLFIVGGGAPHKINKLEDENINVEGFVRDLEPYFSKVQLAVVPLRFGAGIKIKTLETITAQIPTISTDIGAEGIPENEYLLISNSSEEFIERICNLFNSESV